MSEMYERIAALETTQKTLVRSHERLTLAIEKIQLTLVRESENRTRIARLEEDIEALDDRVGAVDNYLKTRWYVIATLASAVAAAVAIFIEVL